MTTAIERFRSEVASGASIFSNDLVENVVAEIDALEAKCNKCNDKANAAAAVTAVKTSTPVPAAKNTSNRAKDNERLTSKAKKA